MTDRRDQELTTFPFSNSRLQLADALFALVWIMAILPGFWMIHGVQWPYDLDGFRDVAIARSFLERGWSEDAFYRAERAWYNPLIPTLLAWSSAVSGTDLPRTFVVLGASFNALAPMTYYVSARILVGPPAALTAVVAFLFLPSRPEAWASATYSPWLFPAIAAQVPLYASLASWTLTLRTPTVFGAARTGLLIGVTLLAHTAPGLLLLGVTWLSGTVFQVWPRGWTRVRGLALLALSTLVALSVMAPFLGPIVWRYGLRVQNRVPATWVYDPATPLSWLMGMKVGDVAILTLAAWGMVVIVRRAPIAARAVTIGWGAVAGTGLIHTLLAERLTSLPTLVPAYHFLFLLRAWKWLLLGVGLHAVLERTLPWLRRRVSPRVPASAAVCVVSLVIVFAMYPRYVGREAFTGARERALAMAERADERQVYSWILRHTSPVDIFVAEDVDALQIVAPAGRQVVSVRSYFSNPYVSWEDRATDRDRMMTAFREGDIRRYDELARAYGVTHLLVRAQPDRTDDNGKPAGFCRILRAGGLSVFVRCQTPL